MAPSSPLIARPAQRLARLPAAAQLGWAGAACLLLALALPSVQAQPAPHPPKVPTARNTDWAALSSSQQQTLAPLHAQWQEIDAARRAKWIEVAARYPSMSADERHRLQERMAEWARMSPAERSQARLSFQQAKQVPSDQRQARWEAYQALAPEERQALTKAGVASSAAGVKPMPGAQLSAASPVAPVKPVAPTVVQVKPGATTTLMNAPPKRLTQRNPDAPRIAANPNTVDSVTLLPKRGPQGAPQRAAAASQPAAQPQ